MSSNPESILDSVKKSLGFESEYTAFDPDITMFINATFGSLQQLGVGGDTGFIIQDNTTLWSQYVSDLSYLGMVKIFIYMAVRLAFDPPATSFGIDAITQQIAQLGWRINVAVEKVNPPDSPFRFHEEDDDVAGVLRTFLAPKVVQLAFSPVMTPDASQGNMFYLTLTANCTLNAPVNGSDGEHITIEITSAGYTVTWGAGWDFGDAGTPTLSDDKSDVISAYYRATATSWRAGVSTGF